MKPRPTDTLENLYDPYAEERTAFGEHWIGPDHYPHMAWTPVARYEPDPGGDGQPCTVECAAAPARFYRLRVEPSTDSLGNALPGYTIETGSGLAEHVAESAWLVSVGMIRYRPDEVSP